MSSELLITRAAGAHAGSAPKMGAILVSASEDKEGVRLRLDDDKNSDFWLEFVLHPSAVREIVRLSGGTRKPSKLAKMTAEEFKRKWGEKKGVIFNLACSHCGNREEFQIQGKLPEAEAIVLSVTDPEHFTESIADDACVCQICSLEGTGADFTIEGLDE